MINLINEEDSLEDLIDPIDHEDYPIDPIKKKFPISNRAFQQHPMSVIMHQFFDPFDLDTETKPKIEIQLQLDYHQLDYHQINNLPSPQRSDNLVARRDDINVHHPLIEIK